MPLLIAESLRTRKQFNIGLWRQFCQAFYLRFGSCKLDPWEYFFFQVFLGRYPLMEKQRFVGWRREIKLDRAANTHAARGLANDKLACHALLTRHGMPLPEIVAVYGDFDPCIAGKIKLENADDVTTFLRHSGQYPLFVKPVRGKQGQDTYALHRLVDGALQLSSDQWLGLADFIARLDPARPGGIVFQKMLRPSPAIEAVCGRRLTSVRLIVIITSTGPEVLSAVWRIPTGANITDNFNCGRNGNIIAGIELATGKVQRVVQGINWINTPVNHHPDTGSVFANLHLPDWPQICALCLDAAMLLPGLRLQHWDVALTDHGPVIMEINVEGGMRTHQIVQQRGIYGTRLQKACEP